MKFSTVLSSVAFAVLVSAASETSPAPTASATLSPAMKCVSACKDDLSCQAECLGNPAPNSSMVQATTDCVAACPKGEGSAEDTEAYAKCASDCISNDFYSSTLGQATGAAATATSKASSAASGAASAASSAGSSGNDAVASGSAALESGASSASGSVESGASSASGSASPSSTDSGAAPVVATGLTGLFAVLAAVFAL